MAAEINGKNFTKEEYQTAVFDLIYLVGCAVNEITPDRSRVEQMNLAAVHGISTAHSLASVACFALEDAYGGKLPVSDLAGKQEEENPTLGSAGKHEEETPASGLSGKQEEAAPTSDLSGKQEEATPISDLFATWEEEKNQTIYKTLLFDAERRELLSFLEESGIWYAPLKGIILKDLYPRLGMRQMADNDIFFDAGEQEKVHEWFLDRGYESEDYKINHHNTYFKKPVYNFEMHTALFLSYENPELDDYFENAAERLIPQDGTAYGRRFSDDDFYIYITAHTYKHYDNAGSGLRSLVDCYVYNKAKGDGLNRTYIHDELAKMGIADFEEGMRALSEKLFAMQESVPAAAPTNRESVTASAAALTGGKTVSSATLTEGKTVSPVTLTKGETAMLWQFAFAGTYGSIENRVSNDISSLVTEGDSVSGSTKLKYLWRRLFPTPEFFKCNFPFFYRHKWLLPVGYVYRLIHRLIVRRGRLKKELQALKKL